MESTCVAMASRPAGTPAVDVDGVTFTYPDGTRSLRDVSLVVHEGEKVALVGPNGAGKSTLLLHLNGVLPPTAGCVRVFGREVGGETAARVRADVGLLFPNPDDQLFSPTVLEDVAYGPLHMGLPPEEVLRRSREALEAVGMAEFEDRVPHRLSLGQKKRVAIATVLSMGTRVLALDEPTASLDPRARRELIELLRRLPQAMLIATHDLAMVADMLPRALVLDGGEVVADLPSAALLGDAALLYAHGLEPLSAHGHPHA